MKKFASVAAYLRAVPPAPRAALQKLRKTIKAAMPEATDKPLPAALVRKLVKARLAQNEKRVRRRGRPGGSALHGGAKIV